MNLIHVFLASIALNAFFFLFAAVFKTDVLTDITYSLTFVLLSVLLFISEQPAYLVQILPLVMVVLWAVRLGGYLFWRILHIKVDHRFDNRRNSIIAFGSFWALQAITVAIVMLPVWAIMRSRGNAASVSVVHLVPALVVYAAGLIIEAVSDAQKYRYKISGGSSFMATGLWKFSRHPNYFGEMLVWWGIGLAGMTVFSGLYWLTLIGPLFITLLLIYVSGIPLLEKSADRKWGDDPAYIAYKTGTSILVPLLPKKARA